MSDETFHSYDQFFEFYLREHSDPVNRALHAVGTSLGFVTAAAALASGRRRYALLAPLFGYGFAWVGHFVVEKNRPATFAHPLWSLAGDFHMLALLLAGRLEERLAAATATAP